jgi:hypothetical protein
MTIKNGKLVTISALVSTHKTRHFQSICEYNRQRRHFATLQENSSSTYELVLIRKKKNSITPRPTRKSGARGLKYV